MAKARITMDEKLPATQEPTPKPRPRKKSPYKERQELVAKGDLISLFRLLGHDEAQCGTAVPERMAELVDAINNMAGSPDLIEASFEIALRTNLQMMTLAQAHVQSKLATWAYCAYAGHTVPMGDFPSILLVKPWHDLIERLQSRNARLAEVYARVRHVREVSKRSREVRQQFKLRISATDRPIQVPGAEAPGQDPPAADDVDTPVAQTA
jgi:hypothetical protein